MPDEARRGAGPSRGENAGGLLGILVLALALALLVGLWVRAWRHPGTTAGRPATGAAPAEGQRGHPVPGTNGPH